MMMAELAQPGRSDLAVQVVLFAHVLQSQQNNLICRPRWAHRQQTREMRPNWLRYLALRLNTAYGQRAPANPRAQSNAICLTIFFDLRVFIKE